jgi:replicative DNA helicase
MSDHDLDAERAVLGSMLLSPAIAEQLRRMLVGADFYRPAHSIIFEQIGKMMDQGLTP